MAEHSSPPLVAKVSRRVRPPVSVLISFSSGSFSFFLMHDDSQDPVVWYWHRHTWRGRRARANVEQSALPTESLCLERHVYRVQRLSGMEVLRVFENGDFLVGRTRM